MCKELRSGSHCVLDRNLREAGELLKLEAAAPVIAGAEAAAAALWSSAAPLTHGSRPAGRAGPLPDTA